jgi:hypothetical protein
MDDSEENELADIKEIMSSTTPEVRKLISEILKYEAEYRHHKKLSRDNESELCGRIIKLIDREVT